jgi:hypothetical protein
MLTNRAVINELNEREESSGSKLLLKVVSVVSYNGLQLKNRQIFSRIHVSNIYFCVRNQFCQRESKLQSALASWKLEE